MRTLLAIALILAAGTAQALYTTPGTGVVWTMDDLVAHSAGAVTGSGSAYEVHDSLLIAVGDRLTVAPGTTVTFFGGNAVGIEVNGALTAIGTQTYPIIFTAPTATPGAWRGFDYEDTAAGSEFHLAWCEIGYSDIAVDVFGANILVEDSDVHHAANRAFDFSQANGEVRRCQIRDCSTRTITATLTSSPLIEDCEFTNNNIQNTSPYPYINIGLQGVNSPTIRGNRIHGSGHHMSGGISIWASSNAVIEDNFIEGCGYGILCYSTGANPTITGNSIASNNIHPDQVNFGFGIACNGNNAPILTQNVITGHWYGVAAINGGRPNLGDLVNDFPGDDGFNEIHDNGLNGHVYGFYNNTALAQMAQNNYWGLMHSDQEVEDCIWHQVDDPALGLVDFSHWFTSPASAPAPPAASILTGTRAYPNPFNPRVEIELALARPSHVSLTVVDVAGRLVRELQVGDLPAGDHAFTWDGTDRAGRPQGSGTYFYRVVAGDESRVGKLVLVR